MADHTPGPWRFEVRPNQHRVTLVGGKPRYDKTVMDLNRWGMRGATPIFRQADGLLAERIENMLIPIPGREHHEWIRIIDHPDARLIEAAPDLLAALKGLMDSEAEMRAATEDGSKIPILPVLARCKAAREAAVAAIARAEGYELKDAIHEGRTP